MTKKPSNPGVLGEEKYANVYKGCTVKSIMMNNKAKDDLKQSDEEGVTYIYRMYITKNGKRIYRPNGKPFRIPVKN